MGYMDVRSTEKTPILHHIDTLFYLFFPHH